MTSSVGELVVWLVPISGIPASRVQPRDVQGFVASRWMDHDANNWSAAFVGLDDGTAFIRVSTLDDQAKEQLHRAAIPGAPVQLGIHRGTVLGGPQAVDSTVWADLSAPATALAWSIQFATPTAFARGRGAPVPWPDPFVMTSSMTKRWNSIAPSAFALTVPEPKLVAQLVVTDFELTNVRFDLRRSSSRSEITVSASVGRMTVSAGASDVADVFEPLLRLATFTGMGAYTKWGLGVTEVGYPSTGAARRAL